MNEKKIKILLAEDDENLGSLLREYMNAKNFDADLCPDGEEALKSFHSKSYDILVLDVMMPKKDGFSVAKEVRMVNQEIPIIFLTAKSLKEDVLEGFSIGADDYMTKPFSMEELIFRIEAILKRTKKDMENKDVYKIGIYTFDVKKQLLEHAGNSQKLTTKEADLLKLLAQNSNKVLERNYALKAIWLEDSYFNARSMDVYITKLRKYLKDDPNIEIINVHGKGFKLIF